MKTSKFSSRVRLPIAITIATVSALVLACGSSYPSESEGRRYFESHFIHPPDFIKVKSFTKTNGVDNDKLYTMEFKAEIECIQVGGPQRCLKVGQVSLQEGSIEFQKTENGWRAIGYGVK